jgi:hypothetical protein
VTDLSRGALEGRQNAIVYVADFGAMLATDLCDSPVDERYFAERPRQATSAAGGRVTLIDDLDTSRPGSALALSAEEQRSRPSRNSPTLLVRVDLPCDQRMTMVFRAVEARLRAVRQPGLNGAARGHVRCACQSVDKWHDPRRDLSGPQQEFRCRRPVVSFDFVGLGGAGERRLLRSLMSHALPGRSSTG